MKVQNSREKSNERRYSYEDMKLWVEKMIQSKTELLLSEINENNSIIKILSQKLSKAEGQLNKKEKLLQSACQRLFSTNRAVVNNHNNQTGTNIQLMNKLINDKLKDKFQYVNIAIADLQNKGIAKSRAAINIVEYQTAMQKMMLHQIQDFKHQLRKKLEDIKSGNQKYWSKIKGWAKMFEEKEQKCEGGILALHKQIKKCGETLADGVMEVFRLKSFKGRVKEMEKAVYDLEQSFKLIGERQLQMKDAMQTQHYRPQTIQLSYSKDQSQIYYSTENHRKSRKSQNQYYLTTTNEQYHTRGFSKSPIQDPAHSRSISNSSSAFQNFNKKPPLHQDFSILSSVKSDNCPSQFNSRIKSLQNVSTHIAQSRKLMISDIKDRLRYLIDAKGLQTPIGCYLDEYGYLKNQQNNYMFDCEGNMFKLSQEEFKELCFAKVLMTQ